MFELRKIGIVKRASAQLLDLILLAVLATGFMFLISLLCNYSQEEALSNQYYSEWDDFRKEYIGGVASYYGFTYEESGEDHATFTITKDGAAASLDDVVRVLDQSQGNDSETKAAYDAFLLLPPAEKVNTQYRYVYSLLFMMISLGILFSYIVLEFILPIIFKNGQTVGKKVFGICVVRSNCVRIANIQLFARTILGKYAIETMFPVLLTFLFFFGGMGLLALILFIAIFLLNTILFFATKNRTPIHDLFVGTVVVDMKLQMIFDSEEELTQKKAEIQKEFIEASKSE